MHNQRLHTTETREELYQPVKTRPSETFHARMLMVWSMSAGTLIFFILVLGSALGLEYPAPRPPLLVLAVFYVTAAPIAYYLRRSSSIWTLRKDRLWSTIIILLDLAIGTAILFLTGGAEYAFLLLVPAIPFALRLLIGVTYNLAARAVPAAGGATMMLSDSRNPGADRPHELHTEGEFQPGGGGDCREVVGHRTEAHVRRPRVCSPVPQYPSGGPQRR